MPNIFGKTLAPYLKPDLATSGLEPTDSWEDLALKVGWTVAPDAEAIREELDPYLVGVEHYVTGTPAVYRLLNMVRLRRFEAKDQYDYHYIDAVMDKYRHVICPSTQITPKAFIAKYGDRDESAMILARRYENVSEAFKRLRMVFYSDRFEEIRQLKYFGEGRRDVTMVRAGNLLFFRGTREYTNTCYILTRAHMDQIVGCAMRLSNTFAYFASVWKGQDLENVLAYIEFTIEVAAAARSVNAYKVARAFHKCRQMMQMEMLRSVLPECLASEEVDYVADNLDNILRLGKYREVVRQFPLVKRVEVLHIYKWMPSPDFDATSAFGTVRKWHMNPRKSGADPGASESSRAMWERIKAERNLHLAHAIHRMTGAWPQNLALRGSGPVWEDARHWDPQSTIPYFPLGKDIVSQVKDKQTVAASKEAELHGKPRPDETSYLLWYMANKDRVDTEWVARDFPNHGEDNYARVAYKPEAHKPDSRLFYMAPPLIRTLLGELEGNLANVARFYPGCLMGKSSSEKAKILLDVMDPNTLVPGLGPDDIYEVFIIQFDLSKFSPKSNFNVTSDYHRHWSRVFGRPQIAKMDQIGCKSKIIHTTCGLKMEYDNIGADLEGFRGRMMTMFHSDLLGTACRVARECGFILGRSKLAVFIDDGVVKLAAAGEGDEAIANVRRFLGTLQEVYAAAGQDANPSKTCISRIGGEMLAEFYVHSTQMPVGVKAAMRLYPDYENAATTITEEFDTLFSTCQGSVKNGADWLATHYAYAEACLKSINRWARREFTLHDPTTLALLMVTPKSYGGFGLQPLQGLVTTAVTNLTAEGLAMLNRAARWAPGYRPKIYKLVHVPVIARDPLSILRDPLRVRADVPVLMENRLVMAVVDWLGTQQGAIGSFVQEYSSESLKEHARKVAEALLDSDHVSLPVLQRAWKSTPLCQVETLISKFKRSHTVIRFIGRDGLSKIRRQNANDLRRVLSRVV